MHRVPPVQTVLQSPQWFGSPAVSTQTPLQTDPPGLGHWQAPFRQAVVGALHAVSQPPQWLGSLAMSRHVPSQHLSSPEQQLKPSGPTQVTPKEQPQEPFVQNACDGLPQLTPHWPQFCRSLARSVHVPKQIAGVWAAMAQLTQMPLTQKRAACPLGAAPARQSWPHSPQLATSLVRSLQAPLHAVWPGGHPAEAQFPLTQLWPLAHLVPQAPQFCGLVWVSTQAPLQSVSPAGQVQLPLWQS